MTTLDELFPDVKRRGEAPTVRDDPHTAQRLGELFGDRATSGDAQYTSDREQLVALVNGAAKSMGAPGEAPVEGAEAGRRRRRRSNALDVALGAIAVLALAGTGLVAGVQAATANPAQDALEALIADERTLSSLDDAVTSTRRSLQDDVSAAAARAVSLQTTLEGLRDTVDPADIPPGESEAPADARRVPIADEQALSAALAAVSAYQKNLAGLSIPEAPSQYERADVDEGSLSAVGSAIDAAQHHIGELDSVMSALRLVRTEFESHATALKSQLSLFAEALSVTTQSALEANDDASQASKDALTAATQTVTTADLALPEGETALQQYRTAFIALLADQVHQERVFEERAREQREQEQREREQREREQRERDNNSDGDQDGDSETDPNTEPPTVPPTDTPTDPPTDPPTQPPTEPTPPPSFEG